jgi:hypothetical protein
MSRLTILLIVFYGMYSQPINLQQIEDAAENYAQSGHLCEVE